MSDHLIITTGIKETLLFELPTITTTDYSKATKEEKKEKNATLYVDKKLNEIISKVSSTETRLEKIEKTVTVTSVSSQYGKSTDKDTPPTSWQDNRPELANGEFLWMREKYTYSDGTFVYEGVRMISSASGADGRGIKNVVIWYAVTNSNTEPPGTNIAWSTVVPQKLSTQYMWQKEQIIYTDDTDMYTDPICISGEKGDKGDPGEDSIFLQILSSNGSSFKNTMISTTLTVTIIVAGEMITSSDKMIEKFGENAKIIWSQKKFGESEFTDIPSDDSRLSDNGFMLTISANDINTQAVFNCSLDF